MRLTIDADLQSQLETELQHARTANDSKSVSGIVMDAETGAILAWATVPGYDANDYRTVATHGIEQLRDPIVADTYEPGSVMKALTATAALARGVVTPKTAVIDSTKLKFEGATVRNADHGGLGRISVTKAIAYSRNVATARVAAKLGPSVSRASVRLYETWRLLGIGGPTGVDLASEEDGIVPDPADRAWAPVDLANRAFGQGVNVTLVQLARSFAAMVNGGYLVTPHLSVEVGAELPEPARVLEPRVARQIREILEYVTGGVPHYARGTLIPGYQVGGKTGTAQIWDTVAGKYKEKRFNFSFVGFVGRDDPEVIIAVRLADTRPKIRGPGRARARRSRRTSCSDASPRSRSGSSRSRARRTRASGSRSRAARPTGSSPSPGSSHARSALALPATRPRAVPIASVPPPIPSGPSLIASGPEGSARVPPMTAERLAAALMGMPGPTATARRGRPPTLRRARRVRE